MKVKINNRVFDPEKDGPVMIVLSAQDKINIANMLPDAFKYVVYNEDKFTDIDEIEKWMELDEEKSSDKPKEK